jgi:ferredoxin-thioredoxin reductase catalytic subunit
VPELWVCFDIVGEPSDKSLEVMRKFSEQYARKSDTFFCVDKGVTAVVVKVGCSCCD